MFTITSYMMFWSIFFIIFGIALYIFDRTKLVKLCRWWYNHTHKEDLPVDAMGKGFFFNRSGKTKLFWMAFVSLVQSILFRGIEVNPGIEFFMFFVEILFLWFGFLIGPFIYRKVYKNREEILETIDGLDTGRISFGELLLSQFKTAVGGIFVFKDKTMSFLEQFKPKKKKEEKLSATSQEEVDERLKESSQKMTPEEARENIRRYTERK